MSAPDCPIEGCRHGRRRTQLMCGAHWRMVPREMQRPIYAAAREMNAEEEAGGPAYQRWQELRKEAIAAVEMKEADRG